MSETLEALRVLRQIQEGRELAYEKELLIWIDRVIDRASNEENYDALPNICSIMDVIVRLLHYRDESLKFMEERNNSSLALGYITGALQSTICLLLEDYKKEREQEKT